MSDPRARLHVVAGVIRNAAGQILITERPPGRAHAGLWEFPGGKCEPGETPIEALARELDEELGISLGAATPAVAVEHDYDDLSILLDIFEVNEWSGTARGHEGQRLRYVAPESLGAYRFPAANDAALASIRLRRTMLITPEVEQQQPFLHHLQSCLQAGIRFVQFRDPSLTAAAYREVAREVAALCQSYRATLMLNCDPADQVLFPQTGLHLTSRRLMALDSRPCGKHVLLSAACHNAVEIEHAERVGVDFVLISPIERTATHPEMKPLGWQQARQLATRARVPAVALGGLTLERLADAVDAGFYGLAMVSGLWGDCDDSLQSRLQLAAAAARQYPRARGQKPQH